MGKSASSKWVNSLRRHFAHVMFGLAALGILCSTGCSTLGNRHEVGEPAVETHRPTFGQAVRSALFDVKTWLPAAAAVVFAATDLDESVSDWATSHTPIFGSESSARGMSDYLRLFLQAEMLATLIARPADEVDKSWAQTKTKQVGVELLAAGVSTGTTRVLKELTNRERPDGANSRSFPSGHATTAFYTATLSNRNLDAMNLAPKYKYPIQIGNYLMASSVAWARVSGGKHFPSDAFAGAALGHFFSAVIHDVFLGRPQAPNVRFMVQSSKEKTMAQIVIPYDL